MRKTCLLLAVLWVANASLCRADDKPEAGKAAVMESKDAKDAGKDYVEAIGAKDAPACTPTAPKQTGIIIPIKPGCHTGHSAECLYKLLAWATYCPLNKSSNCCHKCSDCWTPPLYTYFLDPYHACASGNGSAGCDKPGCGVWAHR